MTTQLPHPVTLPTTSRGCPLAVRLEREWRALATRSAVVQRARTWGLGVPVSSLDDVLVATGFRPEAHVVAACATVEHNEVVARLLLAARADPLAARVVLQRLLPGLVAAARRWERRHDAATDAFDEVVAAAWAVAREFPLERRPQHLVANLLRDAEYHAFVRARRRRLVVEPASPGRLDHAVESPPLDALAELTEVVACTPSLTAHDRRLLGLLLSGRSTLQVAAALQVSERTVRAHRDSMVSRLRQAVAA
ncbi:MAG: LuxR C-terminal-related transcriptional regulator [Actinomycetota bacterium]|nr:LuxR C-terminal-related transcriptional regulator [Actinomycetota bacterium]